MPTYEPVRCNGMLGGHGSLVALSKRRATASLLSKAVADLDPW
jgi:hypothetical protein